MTLLFDGGRTTKAVLSVTILPREESGGGSEEADGEEEWWGTGAEVEGASPPMGNC